MGGAGTSTACLCLLLLIIAATARPAAAQAPLLPVVAVAGGARTAGSRARSGGRRQLPPVPAPETAAAWDPRSLTTWGELAAQHGGGGGGDSGGGGEGGRRSLLYRTSCVPIYCRKYAVRVTTANYSTADRDYYCFKRGACWG